MTTRHKRIEAVLGPTNTGKTRHAIERMLVHQTGMIGLPLRLLAREVYDTVRGLRGAAQVALITGEERIVPATARYWVCTVEAMPVNSATDFIAVDEIQLCADPERGHIFTERLLSARGSRETLFLGSDSMRGPIADLVPSTCFSGKKRFSELNYVGERKVSRLKERSAIVGFSVENVYEIADLVRQQRGGAAVVTGALSPRTRNAQVAMYQNGDVDILVATDAIGMGLNLDIHHVAFAGLAKFDGRRFRRLTRSELAQIAGRAGRHVKAGTFGVTCGAEEIEPGEATAIEESRLPPVKRLQWRNASLEFTSADTLIASLEMASDTPLLTRAREVDDITALRHLATLSEVQCRLAAPRDVELLWTVCQIPDFRNISDNAHAALLREIFTFVHDDGLIEDDWLNRQVAPLDKTEGDVDALARRIAFVRTWTYVAQRRAWLGDADFWRERTRDIEDRLSDALHERLLRRFVDLRTTVLTSRMRRNGNLMTELGDDGEITVEGQRIGCLKGFSFTLDPAANRGEDKALRTASLKALGPHFELRASKLMRASDREIMIAANGAIMWDGHEVGRVAPGAAPLGAVAIETVSDEAGEAVRKRVADRLAAYVSTRLRTDFENLRALEEDGALDGPARALAFRLVESFGILKRSEITAELAALPREMRAQLRRHRVRFGQYSIFLPPLLRPAPTRLRLLLWGMRSNLKTLPEPPPSGLVTLPSDLETLPGYWQMAGFHPAGQVVIRIDMLERLADLLRVEDAKAGFRPSPAMFSISGTTPERFHQLMVGLGYHAEPVSDDPDREATDSQMAAMQHSWIFTRRSVRGPAAKRKPPNRKTKRSRGAAGGVARADPRPSTHMDPSSPFAVLDQLRKRL